MNDWQALLPLVLIVVVFWFLVARPARRQQHKLAATQAGITVGSEVMLGSGIFGRVASLDEEALQLEVAPGTVVKVARQAVVRVVDDPDPSQTDRPSDSQTDRPTGTTDEPSAGA